MIPGELKKNSFYDKQIIPIFLKAAIVNPS
jgi:hypothetical protein